MDIFVGGILLVFKPPTEQQNDIESLPHPMHSQNTLLLFNRWEHSDQRSQWLICDNA